MIVFDFNPFMDLFNEMFNKQRKEAERVEIQTMLQAKATRVSTTKNNATKQLNELAEAMHDKTKSKIPNDMDGALEGKAAKAGQNFLKDVSKPTLRSAVKGWWVVDEKTRKQRLLEEEFIDEKKKIDSGIETINEKMNEFRRENNRLMENFIQYTKNDEVNINELDWKLRAIEDEFLQEANKSIFKLEEMASELNKEYEKALLELDKW